MKTRLCLLGVQYVEQESTLLTWAVYKGLLRVSKIFRKPCKSLLYRNEVT
jgi:hypothetical protein